MVEEKNNTADRELILNRTVHAPISLVWEVWTNPNHLKNWWGPDGFSNTITEMNVSPNGHFDLIMHGPDGTDYKNHSIYREVIRHKKIVYEHISGPRFIATIEFTPKGDQTDLRWHMLFESKEQFIQVVKTFKADEGLKQNIEKLIGYLEVHKEFCIERIFKAPIEKVFDAFASAEALTRWWGPVGHALSVKTFEFKPGGKFIFAMEGYDACGLFEYTVIDRPHTIQYISSFSDEKGNKCKAPFPIDFPMDILNTLSFTEKNGVTTLRLQGHPIAATSSQNETYQSMQDGMQSGFGGTFDQLDRYLDSHQ